MARRKRQSHGLLAIEVTLAYMELVAVRKRR
jgi:hypothetical protein